MTVQWPSGVSSTEPRQFETHARTLRFQALGRACRSHDIRNLLFGHHEDDYHELLILRLLQGSRSAGLRGMKPSIDILECHGMHGVSASGQFVPNALSARDPVQGFEQGGVRVLRPLLSFPKSRLVATCEAAKLPWLEDTTNADVTMTGRNAIRKVIGTENLPRALQKPALLCMSRVCNEKMEYIEAFAQRLYEACIFPLFDVHVGFVTVQIPPLNLVFGRAYEKAWSRGLKLTVLSRFLRTLAQLVSPKPDIQTRDYHHGATVMFGLDETQQPAKAFPAHGVLFRPAPTPRTPSRGFQQWIMHRESLSTELLESKAIEVAKRSSSDFELWHGTYWVRVKNSTAHPVLLSATTPASLKTFGFSLPPPQRLWLTELLKQIAPGKVKETLLSVQRPPPSKSDKSSRIVSLPTLGVSLPGYERSLQVEVRYKRVDRLQGFKPVKLKQLWLPPSPLAKSASSKQPTHHSQELYSFRRDSSLASPTGDVSARILLPPPHRKISRTWGEVQMKGLGAL